MCLNKTRIYNRVHMIHNRRPQSKKFDRQNIIKQAYLAFSLHKTTWKQQQQ